MPFYQLLQSWCTSPASHIENDTEVLDEYCKQFNQYRHRIIKELERLQRHKPQGVSSVETIDGDIRTWRAHIVGPKDTPYEGGTFQVEIGLPLAYPFAPPDIHFSTKVYHVNIDSDGYICNSDFQWESASTISHLLEVIMQMLDVPDVPSIVAEDESKKGGLPAEKEMARLFLYDRVQYEKVAREWTEKHAM